MAVWLLCAVLCAGQEEEFEFQADVQRVLHIFINSLYTHKEIFLRETISNAADALDKARYLAITDDSMLASKQELEVHIDYDKEHHVLSVTDSGIGMTRDELVNNLGTVAKTGTTQFLDVLSKGEDINLIGQFGVGFYSNFLVAEKIVVTSKHNADQQHIWVSEAGSTFKVFSDPRGNTLGRGTRVSIQLKKDALEFLEEDHLRKIVKKYSEFVQYPIYLRVLQEVSREVELSEEELFNRPEGDEKTAKLVKDKEWAWERINQNKSVWLRDDVEEEEYSEFYKILSKDSREPMSYIHFDTEGDVRFRSLLYIPSTAPSYVFSAYQAVQAPIRLYVKRVLITEEFKELIPRYLSFVKGVVDSDDLPLNVARENVQHSNIMKLISKKLTRKVLQELVELSEIEYEEDEQNEYLEFYKQFGKHLKLGIMEDTANKSKLAKLLRFYSTHDVEGLTSLQSYIERMKDGQDDIYYLAGEDKHKSLSSPLLQKLVNAGYEVLILDDPIDEYSMNALNEYKRYHLQNIGSSDWVFPDEDLEKAFKLEKALAEHYHICTDWLRGIVAPAVNAVTISMKVQDDPSLVTASGEEGQSANLERVGRAQTLTKEGSSQYTARKTWELNPAHPITHKLSHWAHGDPNDMEKRDMVRTLYDISLIQSGFILPNSLEFYKRIQTLVSEDMGIDLEEEPVAEPYVEIEEDEFESLDNSEDNEL